MPELARILRFPQRAVSYNPSEAVAAAQAYLETPREERSSEVARETLANADILVALLMLLRDLRDSRPATLAEEACSLYSWIQGSVGNLGLFDEKVYFLGETAFLAGTAMRQLGRREEASRWFDRAESAFRLTVNPTPGLSNVAYARLCLSFEIGDYEKVLDLTPSLRESFNCLGMYSEAVKCRLLEAMAHKGEERIDEALRLLQPVKDDRASSLQPELRARIISEIADLDRLAGRLPLAMNGYQEALALLQAGKSSMALADLRMFVGSLYADQGSHQLAVDAYRSSAECYASLGMETRVAYLRVLTAEALLSVNRSREAEWEILGALPTIEKQKMVPEGFAAVALLRESVSRRKADPNALRELREHLQAKA